MTAFGTTLRRTSTTIAIGLTAALALTGCGACLLYTSPSPRDS